jgi:biotin carboxyl carrier protein
MQHLEGGCKMRNYSITVNGKIYDITVEKRGSSTAPKPPVYAPTLAVPVAMPKAAATTGHSTKIAAPMPGKIIAIKINVGDSVEKGQELMTMEAMKMHNPVLANTTGIVKELLVQTGDPVQTGSVLAVIG